jgi:hypothetical protein
MRSFATLQQAQKSRMATRLVTRVAHRLGVEPPQQMDFRPQSTTAPQGQITLAPSWSADDAALEAFRQRNAALDGFFYDIGILSEEEAARLAPVYAAEGALLMVGPSDRPMLEIFPDLMSFNESIGNPPKTIVVAGVGSSALGSAAFARNVADATGGPVLAVVSGYGLSDLVTEAVGGYFLFGYLNSLRNLMEPFDDMIRQAKGEYDTTLERTGLFQKTVRRSLDVRVLTELLESDLQFDLLVGHSKGNLVISEALYALKDKAPEKLAEIGKAVHAVTISAKIAFPREMKRVTDVIGALDGFGAMNSRFNIRTDLLVPMAWHHTNTEMLFSLPVTEVMKRALKRKPTAAETETISDPVSATPV